jgi:thiamine pyrophosphate-dependent acetolactate synthase large subunit-like protein
MLKAMVTGGLAVAVADNARAAAGREPAKEARVDPAVTGRQEAVAPAVEDPPFTAERTGSDFMLDVIKSLDIAYVAANPGSSFRGLHESLINYGGNTRPELVMCLHEETSVALATGYAKVTGKPMAAFVHGTVGVQHAAMAIYNAYADRSPVLVFSGNTLDAANRRPNIEWIHSVQSNAEMVRGYLKWDDQPKSLQHFAESTVRGYTLATSAPMGPVMIDVDTDLQELPTSRRRGIPTPSQRVPPGIDQATVRELAQHLVDADFPAIFADRYARTDDGMALLVELAEILGAPVVDMRDRLNFPTNHPLNQTASSDAIVGRADLLLALEPVDLYGTLNNFVDQLVRRAVPIDRPGQKVVVIGLGDMLVHANYQEFQRYVSVHRRIAADPERAVSALIGAVRAIQDERARNAAADRRRELAEMHHTSYEHARERSRLGWDSSPITTGRLCSEIWEVIKNEDWVLCGASFSVSHWPDRLWPISKPYQRVRGTGAAGIGTNIGVAVGVALAHRAHGRVVVNIQSDGDLLYAPGALWTAAHHRIPILNVMHNNRAYHQEVMHIQRMACRHERGIDRAWIGNRIDNPAVDFAGLARSLGVWSEGPIDQPADLKASLRRALAVVKRGEPALVDVITQPR